MLHEWPIKVRHRARTGSLFTLWFIVLRVFLYVGPDSHDTAVVAEGVAEEQNLASQADSSTVSNNVVRVGYFWQLLLKEDVRVRSGSVRFSWFHGPWWSCHRNCTCMVWSCQTVVKECTVQWNLRIGNTHGRQAQWGSNISNYVPIKELHVPYTQWAFLHTYVK